MADFSPEVRPLSAVKARLWAKAGRLDAAFAWAAERHLRVEGELSYLQEFEYLILARMLIARFAVQGNEGDVAAAAALLDRLLLAAEAGGRTGSVVEVLVLQAITAHRAGHVDLASETLLRAFRLAASNGCVRVFLDEGPPMLDLLRAIVPDSRATEVYLKQLLGSEPAKPHAAPLMATKDAALVEPLSQRERDVLRLLRSDLTGPDIARDLVVSLSTVRTHNRSIYARGRRTEEQCLEEHTDPGRPGSRGASWSPHGGSR